LKHLSNFKIFESKETLVSDIREDIEDILIDLVDYGFSYKLSINDWKKYYKSLSGENKVNWVSIEIIKQGEWGLNDIDDYIIRLVNFRSTYNLYPLFEPNPDLNMETALISNYSDKFRNRLRKVAGTTDTYSYDIQFNKFNYFN